MRPRSPHSDSADKKRISSSQSYWISVSSFSTFPQVRSSALDSALPHSSRSSAVNTVMAATIATMAMLNAKCLSTKTPVVSNQSKPTLKPISLLSLQNLPKGLSVSNPSPASTSLLGTALAGAVFSSLSYCDAALAAQQIADLAADGDNRGLALLIPIIPAILWVLYNILPPALNQLNRMRSSKGVIVGLGLGLGAWAASSSGASAGEIAAVADASSNDSRGILLLFVIAPAVLWVLYNILQPALNQLNRMRSQ